MRPPRTLRSRLALSALAGTAAWVAVLTVAFNLVLTSRLHSQARAVAYDRAGAAATTVEIGRGGAFNVETGRDVATESGVWVYDGETLRQPRTTPPALSAAFSSLIGRGKHWLEPPVQPPVELYAVPVQANGHQVGTVIAAVALEPYLRSAHLALLGSLVVALLVLAGVYTAARIIVARALRPVDAMSKQAAEWSAGEVDNRFAARSRHAELQALAANLDQMLDRISATLRHERRLSAELSHELRTPLTHILAEAELLAQGPQDPELAAAHARITHSAERMKGIITSLLQAARVSAHNTPGRCDLVDVLAACADDWPRNSSPVLRVSTQGDTLVAGLPADIAERIVAPVLENARRFARTTVTLEASVNGHGPQIVVRDDGPGVPDEWCEDIFEPGFSPDTAHDGAGLGLALARRLARAAGGDVTCDAGTDGAQFTVTLPGG